MTLPQPPPPPRQVPLRNLVISLVFSMFSALVIFVVASYYFLIPRMLQQQAKIQAVERKLGQMEQRASADAGAASDRSAAAASQ
jgi:hypothetical protein